jgi:ligand-binding sensor domain-containing protein
MLNHKTALHLILMAITICYFFSACKKDNSPSPPDSTPEDSIPVILDSTFTVYNTSNSGVPFMGVLSIVSDWDNNIWLRNINDVIKFDGDKWTIYNSSNSPLPPGAINCLACDKNNVIWVGTTSGLFSVSDGQWTKITAVGNNISRLEIDSNNALWAIIHWGTGNILGKYQDGQWSVYDTLLSDYDLVDICIDKNNKLWIAGKYYHIGIFRFDGTHLDTVGLYYIPNPTISYLKDDREGNIWIQGTLNYYYLGSWFDVFDSNTLEDHLFPSPGFFGNAFASTQTNQWVVGQKLYDPANSGWASASYFNGTTWTNYDSTNSNLPGAPSSLKCVCADHENNIWMGGLTGLYTTKKN